MLKNLFDFKNKSTKEIGINMVAIATMVYISYYIFNLLCPSCSSCEEFNPHSQTNKIGNCDSGTPNVGTKWYNYLSKQ